MRLWEMIKEDYDRSINVGSSDILTRSASDTSRYRIIEMEDEVLTQIVGEYRSGQYPRAPWTVVPAARIKRIWEQAAQTGFVRDTKGLDQIAHQFVINIVKLWVNTIIAAHTAQSAEATLSDHFDDETEHEAFVDWAITTGAGDWRISDYGFPRLLTLACLVLDSETSEEKLVVCDAILNVTHARSDMASWFVQGGTATLNALALD